MEGAKKEEQKPKKENEDEENKGGERGQKRKLDVQDCSDEDQREDSHKENKKSSKEPGKLNKAKNVGIRFTFWYFSLVDVYAFLELLYCCLF